MDKNIDYRHKYKKYKYKCNVLGGGGAQDKYDFIGPYNFKIDFKQNGAIIKTFNNYIHCVMDKISIRVLALTNTHIINTFNQNPCIINEIPVTIDTGNMSRSLDHINDIYRLIYYLLQKNIDKNVSLNWSTFSIKNDIYNCKITLEDVISAQNIYILLKDGKYICFTKTIDIDDIVNNILNIQKLNKYKYFIIKYFNNDNKIDETYANLMVDILKIRDLTNTILINYYKYGTQHVINTNIYDNVIYGSNGIIDTVDYRQSLS